MFIDQALQHPRTLSSIRIVRGRRFLVLRHVPTSMASTRKALFLSRFPRLATLFLRVAQSIGSQWSQIKTIWTTAHGHGRPKSANVGIGPCGRILTEGFTVAAATHGHICAIVGCRQARTSCSSLRVWTGSKVIRTPSFQLRTPAGKFEQYRISRCFPGIPACSRKVRQLHNSENERNYEPSQ